MTTNAHREIFSARILAAPLHKVYHAFANPVHLINWWGPNGFTNTFHEFNLQPGGKWVLTMHGPANGNYQNASVFQLVEPLKLIKWQRLSQPIFEMEVGFEAINTNQTKISFRMIFDTVEECEKIRTFAAPKNEENFDRLERELLNIVC